MTKVGKRVEAEEEKDLIQEEVEVEVQIEARRKMMSAIIVVKMVIGKCF
jgi:hypothetical protein